MQTKTYHEQIQIDETIRLREILQTLPPFAKDYFRANRAQIFRKNKNELCI